MSESVVINDTTYNGVDALALVRADGTVVTFYPDAVRYNEQTLTEEQQTQARQNIGIADETPSIVLPRKLYAVAGHEFVLYYRNILRAMCPDNFAVTTSFASGSSLLSLKPLYDGMLRFTPSADNVGEHTLTIVVKNRRTWETVASKSVTLVISEDAVRTGRNVMFIGDSLTLASTYAAEVQNLSGDGIMSVGTISRSISFNDGTASVKSEGRNSAASYNYVNDQIFAEYDNPFYNPDTEYELELDGKYTTSLLTLDNSGDVSVLKHHFDFAYYMANNGAAVGEPDAVFINLGTNGGNRSAYKAVFIAFDAMIERIKAYNADLPVFLHLFPPKSEAGSTDRSASGTFSGWVNERTWYYDIIQTFIDRYDNDARVILVPTYTMLDPVYDYKREAIAVSARNSEQITMGQNDGTHPATPGYLHMADSYYNILQALWSGATDTIYYTITKNFGVNVSINNSAVTVAEGGSYSATLTPAEGYALDSVSVTMGGVAVSVLGGSIDIPNVTGDIVITATAVEAPTVNNLVDPSTANDDNPTLELTADEWINGYYVNSSREFVAASGYFITDHIPITDDSVVTIDGVSATADGKSYMFIGMDDGRIFRNVILPYLSTQDGSGATLVEGETIKVTINKFGQAGSWPGKVWARISGIPADGKTINDVIVTVE